MTKQYLSTATASAIAIALCTQPLSAQSNSADETTDVIIVEGTRLNQKITEVGSSVSVITADDIELQGFDFALDAIASAPGVTINQNGAFGGSASVRIRGAASEQTLVLIDGLPVNDPSTPGGGYDFARLDTEQIDRIEILKGPQSTLWGSDAIGGVVAITTKKPEKRLGGSAFAEYGSFDTFRGGASVSNASDRGDFRVAIAGIRSDGISKADEDNGNTEKDGFNNLTLSGHGGLNLGDLRFDAKVLWSDASTDFDSFSGGAQGSVADGDESSDTNELNLNLSAKFPLFGDRLENLLLVGNTRIERDNFSNGAPSFSAEGERTVLRYQGTLAISPQHNLAFGTEREQSSSGGDETAINGFFGLYEFKPIDAVTITGGVRVDDHETFGSETTGRVAGAFNPTDNITLRASWGQGFKAPTIFQTTFFCCGATAPNTDLQPEHADAFDVGAEWRSDDGNAEFGVTYFNKDVENQIGFSFAVGGYQNIASVKSEGIEVSGFLAPIDWLSVSAAYSYIDADDGAGGALILLPKHTGDVTVSIDPEGPLSGAVLVRYNGPEQNLDTTRLDGWTRVDLTARYAISEQLELFGRVENVLDNDYQQILGYGTPGISGNVGLRLRY